MKQKTNYNKVSVLVVGGGPAGLSAAITAKIKQPDLDICVIEKGKKSGNHNLSGAALERKSIEKLLDFAKPDWRDTEPAKDILGTIATKDQTLFMPCKKFAFDIGISLKLARLFKLAIGQMDHNGDYVVSVSKLTNWLSEIAQEVGVEIYNGFAVGEVVYDNEQGIAKGVLLVDQGLNKDGSKGPAYIKGEFIEADYIILSEGCDGYVTEKFIENANLKRKCKQLYSVGVKEIIEVTSEQYAAFGSERVVHALGYPLWRPILGPAIFGGGVMYAMGDNKIAVGMIAALDWKHHDFNPQDALSRFKQHRFVRKFIEGGSVVEAGAKMIPEAGYNAIPRDPQTNSIGKANVAILGDSAGLVNMIKIKGLHNAIESGMAAGQAIATSKQTDSNTSFAETYTEELEQSGILNELKIARKYRQTIAKFGLLFGMPLASPGPFLPAFEVESDFEVISSKSYPFKLDREFDKHTFTALAGTSHREEQPCHLIIDDPEICIQKCVPTYNAPCITFCPAGVYETVNGIVRAANPSNCLHCKTCQRKCPFDNIRWKVPEGGGGPQYSDM